MSINVNKFIENNYTEYLGDSSFLQPITEKTQKLWDKCKDLLRKEQEAGGVLDIETEVFSGIDNFQPGYIDRDNELIVGLQTDAPLKRIINPYGGIRMVWQCLKEHGVETPHELDLFHQFRKTHNEGVFDAYSEEVLKARHNGLITGLPDAYGRGRIIGDYRRVALYGTDYLIEQKQKDLQELDMFDIQLREEVAMQIRALRELTTMAARYGIMINKPATNARDAIQAIYFAYLAGAKESNGAATSLGRVSTFIDIYIENDLKNDIISEQEAQELIDQFIIKLRFIRHLRTSAYDELFAGDPTWVTEAIGGMLNDEQSLVTKTSFRFLHALEHLGAAPEPNLTVLWSENLPENFKKYCAEMSIKTCAIQYENDDLMRPKYGNDYSIACCVSAMKTGKQMQFFGARCNLAKALLYAINEGKDERTGELVIKGVPKLTKSPLDLKEVYGNYLYVLRELARIYSDANNVIHFMHDKYAYESIQMALHDTHLEDRLMAFGIAGYSVMSDSLASIKFAKVTPIRNEEGIAIDFKIEGDFPKYGNDIDEADALGVQVATYFKYFLETQWLYRNAKPTLSILTITSNIMYGKKTGATPDGRKAYAPFAPGANPLHGREENGALASLNSVAKIPYQFCDDGISNTFTIIPSVLGKNIKEQVNNLCAILDGYFEKNGHHINVNVFNKETLEDAIEHPENYPNLTIRISGYAVLFNSLTDEQKREVLNRTFHGGM